MAAINGLWSPLMAGWRIMLDMRGESNPNCLFPSEYFHPGSREDRGSGMLQLMITQSRGIRFDLGNWEKRKLSVATSLQPAPATAIWSKAHVCLTSEAQLRRFWNLGNPCKPLETLIGTWRAATSKLKPNLNSLKLDHGWSHTGAKRM